MPKSIKTYTLPELSSLLTRAGQPGFRAKQLVDWLYAKQAKTFDEMTNLPEELRKNLNASQTIDFLHLEEKRVSFDGTRKYLLRLYDGEHVEAVGIPSEDNTRLTVCVSSQVGCLMRCAFCATGQAGFTRNLYMGEIIEQVLFVQKDFGQRVSNVVVMGQGEPFLNFDHTRDALKVINDKTIIGIGARHITVSTCGIVDGIYAFAEIPEQFTLAVSLHAARQNVRDTLMPGTKNISLENLKEALLFYVRRTNRRVTLEYLMIKGVNDSTADLDALICFTEGLLCHINFLQLNEVPGSHLRKAPYATITQWKEYLSSKGKEVTVRSSRGADICGACGQLKNTQ